MTNTTYVHGGIEVTLTGKTATRKIPARGRAPERADTLYEITPADKESGSWTKWVRKDELYIINE